MSQGSQSKPNPGRRQGTANPTKRNGGKASSQTSSAQKASPKKPQAKKNSAGEVPQGIVIPDRVRDWLEDRQIRQAVNAALANWMNDEEFLAQVLIALNVPKIRPCTTESKFLALMECASLQLLPTIDQVAFIPFENSQPDGSKLLEVEVTPQWQGYKALMERHPDVLEVEAEIVMEGEHYHYDAHSRQFTHEFDPFVDRDVVQDLSNVCGGYLRITYTDYDRPAKFHFVTQQTIVKARSCAKTEKIWDPFPRPMTLKTIYRDGYARRVVPIDPLVNRKVKRLLEGEDKVHENDPSRATIETRPVADLTRTLSYQPPAKTFVPRSEEGDPVVVDADNYDPADEHQEAEQEG